MRWTMPRTLRTKMSQDVIDGFNLSKELLALNELAEGDQTFFSITRALRLQKGEFGKIRLGLEGFGLIEPLVTKKIDIYLTPMGERVVEAARMLCDSLARLDLDPEYRPRLERSQFPEPLDSRGLPEDEPRKETAEDKYEAIEERIRQERMGKVEAPPVQEATEEEGGEEDEDDDEGGEDEDMDGPGEEESGSWLSESDKTVDRLPLPKLNTDDLDDEIDLIDDDDEEDDDGERKDERKRKA